MFARWMAAVVVYRVLPLAAAALVAVPLAAWLTTRTAPQALGVVRGGPAAALVDGHPISIAAYRQEVALFTRLYAGPQAPPNTPAGRTIALMIADRAIDQVVGEYLITRATAQAHVVAPRAEVDRTLHAMLAAAGGVDRLPSRWGMTVAQVRHSALLSVLNLIMVRLRHDRHWLENEAAASDIVYDVGSRAGRLPDAYPAGEPGRPAPLFVARDLAGRTVALAGLRGRPAIVTLWSAHCLGCGGDLALLEGFARRHPQVQVVALDQGDGAAVVAAIARAMHLTYALWLDGEEVAQTLYSPDGLPATYVLDAGGVIRDMNMGPMVDQATLASRAASILPGR